MLAGSDLCRPVYSARGRRHDWAAELAGKPVCPWPRLKNPPWFTVCCGQGRRISQERLSEAAEESSYQNKAQGHAGTR